MAKSTIAPGLLTELNRQLNHEINASHAYLALSLWCSARSLRGFARFFSKQAGEEQTHAGKIIKHLLDRGVEPELEAIARPEQDFGSLFEVATRAQKMEQLNTQGIHAVYEAALTAKDYPAQVLMHWFINEQVEEEAWAAEMVDRVQGATCAGSLSSLDRHIESISEEGAKAGA